jgi:hypothetical protein
VGYTGVHREKGISSKDFFQHELFPAGTGQIIESATVGSVFYAAVKTALTQEVWGLVVIFKYDSKDYFNFTFKEMSDDMGPYYYDCPKRVLDKLTPTDNRFANDWREKCYAKAARQKIKPGDTIQFDSPVEFSNGEKISRFKVISLRPQRFTAEGGYSSFYRIPKRVYETATVVDD